MIIVQETERPTEKNQEITSRMMPGCPTARKGPAPARRSKKAWRRQGRISRQMHRTWPWTQPRTKLRGLRPKARPAGLNSEGGLAFSECVTSRIQSTGLKEKVSRRRRDANETPAKMRAPVAESKLEIPSLFGSGRSRHVRGLTEHRRTLWSLSLVIG